MPVKVGACHNVSFCLKDTGLCFCCVKGHEGGPRCIREGNPDCPDYSEGLAFDAEEIERLERNVIYN